MVDILQNFDAEGKFGWQVHGQLDMIHVPPKFGQQKLPTTVDSIDQESVFLYLQAPRTPWGREGGEGARG